MKKNLLVALATGSLALGTALWAAPNPPKPARKPAAPSAAARTAAEEHDLPSGNVNAKSTESFEPKFEIKSPPAPYLTPEQAIKTFKLPPGFRIELVAAEPMVEIPVTMQFDPDGRLWVVEMRAYMPNVKGDGEDQPIGRVSVLEDTDGDGRMDKSTVFLDGLVLPRAIALVDGGALIGTPPNVIFARDTDGDGKADDVNIAFRGYGISGNPEHKDNGLMWAMDNWIYNAKSAKRFRLKDGKWVEGPTAFRGQWGISQDDLGRLYYNSNSDVLRMDVTPAEYLTRNRGLARPAGMEVQPGGKDQSVWPGRVNYGVNRGYKDNQLRPDGTLATVTAACGPVVYRGDLFPEEFRGNAFVCEPSGNCVMRKVITERDLVPASKNPYSKTEFLTSTDERFRPVNLFNGPDGALYVVDIYHGILQHKTYETPYLIKQIKDRALDQNNRKGRIWRIVPENAKANAKGKPQLAKATAAQLVETLNHPNGWWRDTAQQLLVEKADAASVPLLEKLVSAAKSPVTKLHALWTLHGMNKLTPDTVTTAFGDADARVRATAIRVAEALLPADAKDNNGELFDQIVERVGDSALEVQLQLACTLSGINKAEAMDATAKILKGHLSHPYIRDAAIAGLRGRELEFAEMLLADQSFAAASPERMTVLQMLGLCVSAEGRATRVNRLLDRVAALPASAAWQQAALLDGLAGDPKKTVKKRIQLDAEPATLASLQKSPNARVSANAARLASNLIWPGKPGYVEIKVTPLNAQEQALFEKGKVLYSQTCAACHQPNGQGQEGLAPPLVDSEWVEGSHARLVRIVLGGLRGPVTVNGSQYDLEMPAMELIFDDEMIASLLTYIRREWDHTADPVGVEQVKAIRAQTKGRSSQWTVQELQQVK